MKRSDVVLAVLCAWVTGLVANPYSGGNLAKHIKTILDMAAKSADAMEEQGFHVTDDRQ